MQELEYKTIKVLPKQMEFLKAKEREILMSGGMGSGKSVALCIKLIQQASIPNNICLLVRKHLTTLRKSTLRILLEPEGNKPPILPQESYEHNKLERVIQLNGGGTIIYTGCDDPLSIRSMNVGDIFVDEASELDEKEYMELLFRLRVDVGSLGIYSATNPSHKGHFLYKRFEIERNDKKRIIYSSSLNNSYLPKNNLDWLDSLTGDMRERYIEGKWCDSEKLIYNSFSYTNNVKDIGANYDKYIIAVDYGYTNPTALLLCGIDNDDNLFIIEEWFKSRQLITNIVKEIKKMISRTGTNNIVVVIDPSAAGLIAECEAADIPAQKANNDVMLGIDRVRDKISMKKLIVNTTCINTIKELSNYSYDEFGKPYKVDDHAADATRYAVNYLVDTLSENNKVYVF